MDDKKVATAEQQSRRVNVIRNGNNFPFLRKSLLISDIY